jgi:hypothetical protein
MVIPPAPENKDPSRAAPPNSTWDTQIPSPELSIPTRYQEPPKPNFPWE